MATESARPPRRIWQLPTFLLGLTAVWAAVTYVTPPLTATAKLSDHAETLAAALDGGDLATWEANYREAAGVFRAVIDHWYADDFMTLALAPGHTHKRYIRSGVVSLLAGDVFEPDRPAARKMAVRMPSLAARVRAMAASA